MDEVIRNVRQRVNQIPYNQLSDLIKEYIKSHPYQTAFQAINGVVFFAPSLLTGPLLAFLGFTPAGPAHSSIASAMQASLGNVGAGSTFAILQSAGMGGYGVAVVNGFTHVASLVAGAAGAVGSWLTGDHRQAHG